MCQLFVSFLLFNLFKICERWIHRRADRLTPCILAKWQVHVHTATSFTQELRLGMVVHKVVYAVLCSKAALG